MKSHDRYDASNIENTKFTEFVDSGQVNKLLAARAYLSSHVLRCRLQIPGRVIPAWLLK